jgi:hypothetical protein
MGADKPSMETGSRRPVYSILSDCSELEEGIHDFVVGLAEQVDLLQDDEHGSDYEALEERASLLAGQADRMGYPELSRATLKVVEACSEELKDAVQKGLFEVTELARCIRMGHRGAA